MIFPGNVVRAIQEFPEVVGILAQVKNTLESAVSELTIEFPSLKVQIHGPEVPRGKQHFVVFRDYELAQAMLEAYPAGLSDFARFDIEPRLAFHEGEYLGAGFDVSERFHFGGFGGFKRGVVTDSVLDTLPDVHPTDLVKGLAHKLAELIGYADVAHTKDEKIGYYRSSVVHQDRLISTLQATCDIMKRDVRIYVHHGRG